MQIQFKMLKRDSCRLPENSWETHCSFSKTLKQNKFSGSGGKSPPCKIFLPEKSVSRATTPTPKQIYTVRKWYKCATKQLHIYLKKRRQQSCGLSPYRSSFLSGVLIIVHTVNIRSCGIIEDRHNVNEEVKLEK